MIAQSLGIGNDLGHVQECFGGDAADVEADTAQGVCLFDEGSFETEVGRPKGGGVSGRTTTDDDHFA